MAFDKNGNWVSDSVWQASPEGQYANTLSNFQRQGANYGPSSGFNGQNAQAYTTAIRNNQSALTAAEQRARSNSPEWQAAVANYNAGKPVTDYGDQQILNHLASYYKEGQAAQGKLTPEMGAQALQQWKEDSSPGASAWALDAAVQAGQAATLAMIGGSALGYAPTTPGSLAAGGANGAGANAVGGGAMGYGGTTTTGASTLGGTGATQVAAPIVNASTMPASTLPASTNTLTPSVVTPKTAVPTEGFLGTGLTNGQAALGLGQIGAGLYEANKASKAADDAAAANAAATKDSNALAEMMFNQNQANQKPWLEAGTAALGKQQGMLNNPASYQQDPYNAWLQDQGNQGINRSAAAKGTLNSGSVLAELSKYNQGMAGQGFNDQYNRWSGLSGTGQATANTMGGQATAYANQIGQNNMNNATNQANAGMWSAGQNANMVNGTVNALSGMYGASQQNQQNQQLINALNRK